MYRWLRSAMAARRERWRGGRAELFMTLLRPEPGARLLDVGGGDGEFAARLAARAELEVTVADLPGPALETAAARGFRTVVLGEEGGFPFGDGEFDVVFCNSVIEHVTLPKAECLAGGVPEREWRARSLARQRGFAGEVARVGRRYFVQTPHRHFPIETHTWLPLVNWWTHESTRRLVRWTDRIWVKRCGVADWHLLTERELRSLFPAAEIHVERWLGLPKSLIAYTPAPSLAALR